MGSCSRKAGNKALIWILKSSNCIILILVLSVTRRVMPFRHKTCITSMTSTNTCYVS